MSKHQSISSIDLPSKNIELMYKSCTIDSNVFSEYNYYEIARRIWSTKYREHCEKIESVRYKHLYDSVKLKDLKRIVNEAIKQL